MQRSGLCGGLPVPELRLPRGSTVALVLRGSEIFPPTPSTVLRVGDHVLVAAPRTCRAAVEDRLAAVSAHGRLARWYAALPAAHERTPS